MDEIDGVDIDVLVVLMEIGFDLYSIEDGESREAQHQYFTLAEIRRASRTWTTDVLDPVMRAAIRLQLFVPVEDSGCFWMAPRMWRAYEAYELSFFNDTVVDLFQEIYGISRHAEDID